MKYDVMTIKDTIEKINSGEMYLPAIQRKYVWGEEQITNLLDSILLGYPIGTFLLWDVSSKSINEKGYSFYSFIRDYHERDSAINPPAPNPIIKDRILGVLDDQQRLTSLYIALQGSLKLRLPRKHWNNDDAFPEKHLYFNLLSEKQDLDGNTYEFKFLTDEQAVKESKECWYKVKDILTINEIENVMEMVNEKWTGNKLILRNTTTLWKSINDNQIISYFKVTKENIDDVLDIFVRVNSGGTVLSKSDLLFSTIVSHWDKARDEIEELLKTINKLGERFKFNNDFIMRTCVYLMDMSITLKVETFKRGNVKRIKKEWYKIKNAISECVGFLAKYGFNEDNIISYNAIIPIIYYIYKGGVLGDAQEHELRKYLIIAQVKKMFGVASNSALTSTRGALRKNAGTEEQPIYKLKYNKFNLSQFSHISLTGDRNFIFSEQDIDALFELNIGAYTFMVLSLLYPNLKYSQYSFHQDHLHPYSGFTQSNLRKTGVQEKDIKQWQEDRNKLSNLQLLEGRENESKNKKPLVEWLAIDSNKENSKYIPQGISYELRDYYEFISKRKELMKNELIKIFN